MSIPLLELRAVSYAYEGQLHALRDVSVSIFAGERIAVIGNNGAGKSTFFLCCNGVLIPQSGSVHFRGKKIHAKKRELNELRQHVGIVFQDPDQQLIGATVEEEISFGPMNLPLREREVKTRVEEAIAQMNMSSLRERPPHYLSGGEKKRLSIADILAMGSDMILLDEPTASLDNVNAQLLESTLNDLHSQGKTLVVSTHDTDFAYRWATRILVFHDGMIIHDDTSAKIFEDDGAIRQAGVRLPVVYKMAMLLKRKGMLSVNGALPRSFKELEEYLN